jgi:menaquinone-specific isochorismate synthase
MVVHCEDSNIGLFNLEDGIAYLKEYIPYYLKRTSARITPFLPAIVRFELKISPVDILKWLANQNYSVKLYWSERDGSFATAGIGKADVESGNGVVDYHYLFDRLRRYINPEDSSIRYFGGIRFDTTIPISAEWRYFGSYYFLLPQFEVFIRNNEQYCAYNILLNSGNTDAQLKELNAITGEVSKNSIAAEHSNPSIIRRTDRPKVNEWCNTIQNALQLIAVKEFEKIVLARKSIIQVSAPVNSVCLLNNLKCINPDVYHFCIQPKNDRAFIGASPELLYYRNLNTIYSEAVAGTSVRGQSPAEDNKLAYNLLTSEKNTREHLIVHKYIECSLLKLCRELTISEIASVLKLSRVMHLCSKFAGIIKDGVTDAEILGALHPTPSVGGFPTEKVMEYINRFEKFDRGWYAGPIGWVSTSGAEFVVGIRSELVQKNTIALFSGAGIVAGSEFQAEWDEIENKITGIIKVFNGYE